jgi:hypothetical protein
MAYLKRSHAKSLVLTGLAVIAVVILSLTACGPATTAPAATAPAQLVKPAGCPQILGDLKAFANSTPDQDFSMAGSFSAKVALDQQHAYPKLQADEGQLIVDFDGELAVIVSGDSTATLDGALADVGTIMADCT